MNKKDKIRIAHIIDFLSPGHAPWFQILIQKLDSENYIFPHITQNKKEIDDTSFKLNSVFSIPSSGLSLIQKASQYLNKQIRYYYYKSTLKKNKIQLIHAHFAHVGWEAIKLKKILNIPLIVSFYGYDYQSVPHLFPVWIDRYKSLFKHADIIICEGDNGKNILIQMGCDPSKIKVSNLGVETNAIEFVEREKKEDTLNLVQIANFVEKKGHIYTIESFAKALEKHPNMHLTLIGNGPCKPNVINAIETYGLENNITLVDKIDYRELHKVLSLFHVFIHPSCYTADMDCEGGAPIVLLDAQASGMPVISTYHCDIPDEVIHLKTGYLAEEKNIYEIARGIEIFYFMKQKEYFEYSQRARNHVSDNYNINKNSNSLIEIYKLLVNS